VALAQTLEDEARYCLADCTARGYEGEYCGAVCDYSDVVRAPPEGLIDGRCVSTCSEAGGRLRDCRAYCRKE
jgi:hypothetical protein